MTVTQLFADHFECVETGGFPWPCRYRLEVVGLTVADLVDSAGGWLFDRAMAGWDVDVRLAECSDSRPLRILGATRLSVESAVPLTPEYPPARELAVAVEALARDAEARKRVSMALKRGFPAVTLCGKRFSAAFDREFKPKRYRPSAAARAFKAHALGLSANNAADELFRTSGS